MKIEERQIVYPPINYRFWLIDYNLIKKKKKKKKTICTIVFVYTDTIKIELINSYCVR